MIIQKFAVNGQNYKPNSGAKFSRLLNCMNDWHLVVPLAFTAEDFSSYVSLLGP